MSNEEPKCHINTQLRAFKQANARYSVIVLAVVLVDDVV